MFNDIKNDIFNKQYKVIDNFTKIEENNEKDIFIKDTYLYSNINNLWDRDNLIDKWTNERLENWYSNNNISKYWYTIFNGAKYTYIMFSTPSKRSFWWIESDAITIDKNYWETKRKTKLYIKTN